MKERETTARYMVVYKGKDGNWSPCSLFLVADDPELYVTDDKLIAIRVRDHLADCFKTTEYALLEFN